MEIWKDINGFEGRFMASIFGDIKSINSRKNKGADHLYKPRVDKYGYCVVGLIKRGKKYNRFVHRLVAQAFIPNPENKPHVNHINGIKTDNRVENLEWATISENNKHSFRIGLNKFSDKRRRQMQKMVLNLETGIFYDSIKEACFYNNLPDYFLYDRFKKTSKVKNKTSLTLI